MGVMPVRWAAAKTTAVRPDGDSGPGPRYKWIALSNTTLGVLIATINMSILLIALPDIFRESEWIRCCRATPACCCG